MHRVINDIKTSATKNKTKVVFVCLQTQDDNFYRWDDQNNYYNRSYVNEDEINTKVSHNSNIQNLEEYPLPSNSTKFALHPQDRNVVSPNFYTILDSNESNDLASKDGDCVNQNKVSRIICESYTVMNMKNNMVTNVNNSYRSIYNYNEDSEEETEENYTSEEYEQTEQENSYEEEFPRNNRKSSLRRTLDTIEEISEGRSLNSPKPQQKNTNNSLNSSKDSALDYCRKKTSKDKQIVQEASNFEYTDYMKAPVTKPRNSLIKINSKNKKQSVENNDEENGRPDVDENEDIKPNQNLPKIKLRSKSKPKTTKQQTKYFYHYTTRENLESIQNDKIIISNNGMYGEGVYGTSKPPQSKCKTLLQINYLVTPENSADQSFIETVLPYVECYIRLRVDQLGINLKVPDPQRPEIYFHEGDINLNLLKYVCGLRKRYTGELNDMRTR